MRVGFFIPELYEGGAEKVFVTLANQLYKYYNFEVLLCSDAGDYFDLLNKNIKVVVFNKKRLRSCAISLFIYIRRYKIDLLVSFLDFPNIVSVLLSKLTNTKVIITEHGVVSEKYNSYKSIYKTSIRFFLSTSYRYADRIISVSNGVRRDLISYLNLNKFEDKIKVIYNPIDNKVTKCFSNNNYKKKDNCIKLLFIGRLEKIKDIFVLLKAVKIIVTYHKYNVSLDILGKGSLIKDIEDFIIENELENYVFLRGYEKNIYRYMLNSDILISSSKSEAFGLTIIEALSCGVQVVATNTIGAREILMDGIYGKIVDVGNYEQMAISIIELFKKPIDLYLLQNRVKEFEIDNVIEEYKNIINEVLYED